MRPLFCAYFCFITSFQYEFKFAPQQIQLVFTYRSIKKAETDKPFLLKIIYLL